MIPFDVIQKCCDLIGKDIYVIQKPYANRPFIAPMRVLSVEVFSYTVRFVCENNHIEYTREYYVNREEAEKALQKRIKENTILIDPLLPCPICGGRAEIKEYHNDYIVRCSECGLQTEMTNKMKDAIKAWNERKQKAE